jgi:uncharacterized protein (DUF427 family)
MGVIGSPGGRRGVTIEPHTMTRSGSEYEEAVLYRRHPGRREPGPGQESVWDYPRPPRAEPDRRRAVLRHGGVVVADTADLVRVLETSHPPTFYLPRSAFGPYLRPGSDRTSHCEWKGRARYVDVVVPGVPPLHDVGWFYPEPHPDYRRLRDRVAVYAGPFDAITLDGEPVRPQPGGFYGGWITGDVVGPFKGGAGSASW